MHLRVTEDAFDIIRFHLLLAISCARIRVQLRIVCTNHADTRQIRHVQAIKESDPFGMFEIELSIFQWLRRV